MKSDNCRTGMQQAPHRSLFNALGFTKEELMKTYCNNPKYSNVQVIALEK